MDWCANNYANKTIHHRVKQPQENLALKETTVIQKKEA